MHLDVRERIVKEDEKFWNEHNLEEQEEEKSRNEHNLEKQEEKTVLTTADFRNSNWTVGT